MTLTHTTARLRVPVESRREAGVFDETERLVLECSSAFGLTSQGFSDRCELPR